MKEDQLGLKILEELLRIHEYAQFAFFETDNEILQYAIESLKGEEIDIKNLERIRVEMFLEYTKEMRKELLITALEYAYGLADVEETFILIKEVDNELEKMEKIIPMKISMEKIWELLDKINEEYNRITTSHTKLRRMGIERYLKKYFSVILGIPSTLYFAFLAIIRDRINISWLFSPYILIFLSSFYISLRIYVLLTIPEEFRDVEVEE